MNTLEKSARVSGIVLAAGASRRMGRPKQLLRISGKTLVALAVERFMASRITEIIVVTDHYRQYVEAELKGYRAFTVFNDLPCPSMMDSVRKGLTKVSPGISGCLVLPVDCALVTEQTIKALVKLHLECPGMIIRPHSGTRGGHPLMIPGRFFETLISEEMESLRCLIRKELTSLIDMPCTDKWAFFDIDTPQDYLYALSSLP